MPDFSPELDNKLKALGICPMDLKAAIILMRDLKIRIIKADIPPKATRIALLFTELADRYYAQQKLTATEMKEIQQIAEALFKISKENR